MVVTRYMQCVQELSAWAFCCHFARTKFCFTQSGQYPGPKYTVTGLVSLRMLAWWILVPSRMQTVSTATGYVLGL